MAESNSLKFSDIRLKDKGGENDSWEVVGIQTTVSGLVSVSVKYPNGIVENFSGQADSDFPLGSVFDLGNGQ